MHFFFILCFVVCWLIIFWGKIAEKYKTSLKKNTEFCNLENIDRSIGNFLSYKR